MFVQIKRIILLLIILRLFAGNLVFSQDHKTRNNFTGAWESPASWDPVWAVPQNNVNRLDITINGYITAHNSLTFSGHSSKLIVDDTLVIIGNLTIADNNDVQVNNNGILIVRGNLTISEFSKIETKNYIIVTGNIIKSGSTNNGEFSSDDDPARVFVGGTISPASLTDDKRDFQALNCDSPTNPYPHSDCSHGDMTDIIADRIWPFFQSTYTTATLSSSDADNSFCSGTSVTFTAGGGSNYNFRVNGTSVQSSGSTTYTTSTLTNGSIVDVVVTGTGGTSVTSSGITNTVLDLPVAMATSNIRVLTGSNLTLTGGPEGMTTYSWTGPNRFTANTQSPTVSSAATLAMAGSYNLTVINASGCTSATVTTIVEVNTVLPVATATSNSPVCTGNPLTLTGGPAGLTTYSWTGPNGFTASTQNPTVSPTATVAMAGIYALTVTNAIGSTSAAATTIVVVNATPVATVTSNSPVFTGSPLTLTGGPAGMTGYSWTGPNGFTANTQSPTVSPAATLEMAGTYTLTVTNASGCIASITQSVIVNENPVVIDKPEDQEPEVNTDVDDLFVPSVITPDGDGKNDYFKISENIGKVYLIVFNRWGNEEYSKDDYNNDWDGRNNKGAELPADTYFYVLQFENGKIRKGSLLIKR